MNSLMELLKLYLFFVILRIQSNERETETRTPKKKNLTCTAHTNTRIDSNGVYIRIIHMLYSWMATTTTIRSVYSYIRFTNTLTGCLSTRWKRYSPIHRYNDVCVCVAHTHTIETRVIQTKTVSSNKYDSWFRRVRVEKATYSRWLALARDNNCSLIDILLFWFASGFHKTSKK